jgi:hypothetical protein
MSSAPSETFRGKLDMAGRRSGGATRENRPFLFEKRTLLARHILARRVYLSPRMNDNEDVDRALATAILRLVDQGERDPMLLAEAALNELAGTQRRHPNKVGVLPQVPSDILPSERSIARCVVECPETPIGLQRQTAVPRDAYESPPIIPRSNSVANNKNPNQKQPGEKEEGTFHYNPGNMSGKTIGSKKDADRQQANPEKEQPKHDREK